MIRLGFIFMLIPVTSIQLCSVIKGDRNAALLTTSVFILFTGKQRQAQKMSLVRKKEPWNVNGFCVML